MLLAVRKLKDGKVWGGRKKKKTGKVWQDGREGSRRWMVTGSWQHASAASSASSCVIEQKCQQRGQPGNCNMCRMCKQV
ncbi:hypothetical protein, partial [Pseudomonas aeruginosa]|uniref:hypothetical protein n=1 Tax=Pseudomonas aeruginosa TaxID=287 RepID=UPI002F95E112